MTAWKTNIQLLGYVTRRIVALARLQSRTPRLIIEFPSVDHIRSDEKPLGKSRFDEDRFLKIHLGGDVIIFRDHVSPALKDTEASLLQLFIAATGQAEAFCENLKLAEALTTAVSNATLYNRDAKSPAQNARGRGLEMHRKQKQERCGLQDA